MLREDREIELGNEIADCWLRLGQEPGWSEVETIVGKLTCLVDSQNATAWTAASFEHPKIYASPAQKTSGIEPRKSASHDGNLNVGHTIHTLVQGSGRSPD
jgi:hypothetical protein